ncbi:MAG: AN1-type zinc finger domain-containing protein [Methanosarcina sp.]|jgi:predicted nucleic acid binding AN1-type Zn finger protein
MECDLCGKKESFGFKCHRCGKVFCAEHRLPESHYCEYVSVVYVKPKTPKMLRLESRIKRLNFINQKD